MLGKNVATGGLLSPAIDITGMNCVHWVRLVLFCAILAWHSLFAQASDHSQEAGSETATVHGHADDVAGVPFRSGIVKLFASKTALTTGSDAVLPVAMPSYSLVVDSQGDFKGTVEAGNYTLLLYFHDKVVDHARRVDLPGGTDSSRGYWKWQIRRTAVS